MPPRLVGSVPPQAICAAPFSPLPFFCPVFATPALYYIVDLLLKEEEIEGGGGSGDESFPLASGVGRRIPDLKVS